MTKQHLIPPSEELVKKWVCATSKGGYSYDSVCFYTYERSIADQAARWGADQQLQLDAEQINQAWQKGADAELKACCEWLKSEGYSRTVDNLRTARRPKPPSLAEEALTKINAILSDPRKSTLKDEIEALELSSRALERLQELDKGNE